MTNDPSHGADNLLIAVYLHTSVLLDLLATIEDGFTLVERVTNRQATDTADERSADGQISAPGFLNLFRVGLSGKLGRSHSSSSSDVSEAELTHTYGSLLNRLRRYLVSEDLVVPESSGHDPRYRVGDFVEFSGVIRSNPFTGSFERLQRMLDLAGAAVGNQLSNPPSSGGHGQKRPDRQSAKSQKQELKVAEDVLHRITKDVEREGTNTLVVERSSGEYKAVVTIFERYLRDRAISELLNRDFRVLGKIARHLPKGAIEGVDLLASSGVAGFQSELLDPLSQAMNPFTETQGLQMPTPVVPPPVIEILPIAIYL